MTLIECLEAAETGSRELDARIYECLGYRVRRRGQSMRHGRRYWRSWVWLNSDNPRRWEAMSDYTTSIDAALTLLDEGWEYEITTLYGVAHVELPLNASDIDPQIGRRKDDNVPLALCIAALKAREAMKDE